MEQTAAKKYRVWYRISLIVGLLGLVDLGTRSIVLASSYNIDVGFVVLGLFFPLRFLFGIHVAASIMVYLATILGLAPLWLLLAYFFNQKAKAVENPSEISAKGVKRAKILLWVIGGIFLAIMLFAVFYALANGA